MSDLTIEFSNKPYAFSSRAAGVNANVPWPYPVAIGGHGYFVDTKELDFGSVEILRQAYDQVGEPGEQSLSIEGAWKRTQTDWSGGAGQEYFDDPGSSRTRFWRSMGLDVWTKRGVCLLSDTAKKENVTTDLSQMLGTGFRVYLSQEQMLSYAVGSTGAMTFTTVTGTPVANVVDMATDGASIFVSFGASGIYKTTVSTGNATSFYSGTSDHVMVASGQLFASLGNELFTVSGAGAKVAVLGGTYHAGSNFAWIDGTGTPNGAFFAGNTSQRGMFFFVTFNETTGALGALRPAGELPIGEQVNCLYYANGYVLIGTNKGFRLGQPIGQDNSGLVYGPLVEVGNVTEFAADGRFVWFTWPQMNAENNLDCGVGRIDLSTFTATGVPAYASDIYTTGIATAATGVARANGTTLFLVPEQGVYGETVNLSATGWFDSGHITYGSPEIKVATSIDVRAKKIVGGTISVGAAVEGDLAENIGTYSTTGAVGPEEPYDAHGLAAESHRVRVTLTRDPLVATQGPCLTRWTQRVVAAPLVSSEFIVPILLHEMIADGDSIFSLDVDSEWTFLTELERTRKVILFQMGERTYSVTIRSVRMPRGFIRGFTEDRKFINGTAFVRMVTAGG
jgi:hypothetical protein